MKTTNNSGLYINDPEICDISQEMTHLHIRRGMWLLWFKYSEGSENDDMKIYFFDKSFLTKKKSVAFSLQANNTDARLPLVGEF
jgi:hypothetical protein